MTEMQLQSLDIYTRIVADIQIDNLENTISNINDANEFIAAQESSGDHLGMQLVNDVIGAIGVCLDKYDNESLIYVINNLNGLDDAHKDRYLRNIEMRKILNSTDDDRKVEFLLTHCNEEHIFKGYNDDCMCARVIIQLAINHGRFDIVDSIHDMIAERM